LTYYSSCPPRDYWPAGRAKGPFEPKGADRRGDRVPFGFPSDQVLITTVNCLFGQKWKQWEGGEGPADVKMNSTENIVLAERIERRIYALRGSRVMLSQDLAELYDVPAKQLNRAARRNLERFPDDFMFRLTREGTAT
jgi:hypothetical protein